MKWSFRTWISIITFVLIALLLFLSHKELAKAWELLGQVNLWILALFIPLLLINNYAAAEMIFAFLKHKGQMKHINPFTQIRIAFEMNFANHALPSGGASGLSYMAWRLKKLGVPTSSTTMALAIRFAVGFAAFILLLIISVIAVTIDGHINRWIILVSSGIVSVMIAVIFAGIFLIRSTRQIHKFSDNITAFVNGVVRRTTLGRTRKVIEHDAVENFLLEMHKDYLMLRKDRGALKMPFIWAIVFTVSDAALFWVAFWALGSLVNPAPVLIAYGVATMAGFIVITPGGSGAYEALMAGFLVIAGMPQETSIAGTVLTRAILLVFVLAIGYVLYQQAIITYGKKHDDANSKR